jgi:hypothetical protein
METKIKVTVEKLKTCLKIAEYYQNQKSKFGYACLVSIEKIKSALKNKERDLNNKVNELSLTGKDGEILYNSEGRVKQTKEIVKQIEDFIEKQNAEEVDYEPYFATDLRQMLDKPSVLNLINGVIVNINIEDLYKDNDGEEYIS